MNWKKIVKGLLVLLLVLGPAGRIEAVPIAQAEERLGNYTGPSSGTAQDDNVKASLDLLHSKVGGGVDNIGTGNAFYVDSNVASEGAGTSWIGAKDTLDEAVDLCTNNNGDVIYVAAGHNENWDTVDSADLDVIGITVIGLGTGTDRPRFDYDDTDPELVIGAANVKIYNLTFQPSVTAVVHAIEIEDDADGSIVDNCEFLTGEAAGDEFIDAIQLALASDDIIISNNIVTEVTAGANTWLDASTGIVDNLAVVGNRIWGDYAEGGIYSNKACTQTYVADNTVTNISTGIAAIVFSGAATGTLRDNYAASDTPGTIMDPGSMEQSGNVEADYGAAEDAEAGPAWAVSGTTGTGNYPVNVETESLFAYILSKDATAAASTYVNTTDSLEALRDHLDSATVLGGLNMDHLLLLDGTTAYPEQCATDSILAKILADDAAANPNTYNNTTDSLEAIANHVQTLITTGAGTGTAPTGITNESILAFIMAEGATATASTFNNTTDSLEAISNALAAGTGVTTALDADFLDHLVSTDDAAAAEAYPTSVVSESIFSFLMCTGANPNINTYNNTTDSLEAISIALAAGTGVTTAIDADLLDRLVSTDDSTGATAYPDSVAQDSILAYIMGDDASPVVTTYNNTTDSLEAISNALAAGTGATAAIDADGLDHLVTTADGTGVFPTSAAEDSILAKILGDDATAVATTYDNQTDSLEALGIKTEQIAGADGVATFPAAAQADDAVSLAEVLRYIQEKQLPRMELKANADLTGYDDAVWFTVTGDVLVRIVGVVGATGITTTSGTTTLTLGTTEDVDAIIPSTVMDNGDFATTDVWVDNNPEDDAQEMGTEDWVIIGGGADISLFRNVDDITAGTLTLYCWWVPLSADGDVVAP